MFAILYSTSATYPGAAKLISSYVATVLPYNPAMAYSGSVLCFLSIIYSVKIA